MFRGGRIRVAVLAAGVAAAIGAACGSDGTGRVDAGIDADDCPMCSGGQVCRFGICIDAPAPCGDDSQCLADTYCDETAGECYPWGIGPGGDRDPTCARTAVPGVFFPGVQCEWLGPPPGDPFPDHRNVLGAPVVVDFAAGSDPELSRPSIVFISYNFTDGGGDACRGDTPAHFGVIRVIDGRSCEQQASIDTPRVIASTSLAVGDLDGDGSAEIVGARVGGGLAAWTADGLGGFQILWETTSTYGAGECNWGGPSIHDLDGMPGPEVILYGAVFDASGSLVDANLPPISSGSTTGYIPVVADVDADGVPELVTGAAVYGWDALLRRWVQESTIGPNAQTAVADLGTFGADPMADARGTLDGVAEIVTISTGTIRAYTLAGRSLFALAIPGGGNGGPPTIADFDGDGRAEFATAGGSAYTVFDLDCDGTRPPGDPQCASGRDDGVLWSQPSQDLSSNMTGSSVFDFEGDGRAEAVYADECYTRVYDGTTGVVMYSRYRTSCTWYENPVIADVDADYNAEIVIPSNTNCSVSCPAVDPIFDGIACVDESDCPASTTCVREMAGDTLGRCRCGVDADCAGDGFVCLDPIAGPSPAGRVCRAAHGGPATAYGVRVIADGLDRWVNTRRIWNQHAYAVTNVGDGGEIPLLSAWDRNWDVPGLNSFRQNAPGQGFGNGQVATPDLTVRGATYACIPGLAGFAIEVCNRGTEPVGDGVPIAAYVGTPPGAPLACATVTESDLHPGLCVTVECKWPDPPAVPTDVTIVVDDDGMGGGVNTECREENNSFVVPGVSCP